MKHQGWKRRELQEGVMGSFFAFVNGFIDPYGNPVGLLLFLKTLKEKPSAAPRQKIISEVMTGVERVRIDTERNFLDVLDKVHEISADTVEQTHVFTLSQICEGLLLKMGEKGNDGGQFFTPREVIRAMVRTISPGPDETIYDPGCGTGGFLAQSFEFIKSKLGDTATGDQLEALKMQTFWGREKENLIYPHLPQRSESPLSWTVDLEFRKKVAADEAKPFKEHAYLIGHEADQIQCIFEEDELSQEATIKKYLSVCHEGKEISGAY